MLGQSVTNCILAVHKIRRHSADERLGGWYPNGGRNISENESLRPSIFGWERGGMEILCA